MSMIIPAIGIQRIHQKTRYQEWDRRDKKEEIIGLIFPSSINEQI